MVVNTFNGKKIQNDVLQYSTHYCYCYSTEWIYANSNTIILLLVCTFGGILIMI